LKTEEEDTMTSTIQPKQTFVRNSNNDVIAIMTEEHAKLPKDDPRVRIFTFCPDEWWENTEARLYFTGTHSQMKLLLQNHRVYDHAEYRGSLGWSGYVPYSNGEQWRADLDEEHRKKVVSHRTDLADVVKAFGPEALSALATC
jgi:hypothetical protein